MEPYKFFNFCPKCGQHRAGRKAQSPFECDACGFVYYFNPAIAAAAFVVRDNQQVLFIRRAKEPAKGKLALPGGFIDMGETVEEAPRRELREEVQLEAAALEYLASFPNEYLYREITYRVLDFFFIARVTDPQNATAQEDVESICWLNPSTVPPEDIAFPSVRSALQLFCSRRKSPR